MRLYPTNRRPFLPLYPANRHSIPTNRRPVLPTAAVSCQPPSYLANRRPILPTAALSGQPPPYTGTSLIRNCFLVEPYSRPMPRALR